MKPLSLMPIIVLTLIGCAENRGTSVSSYCSTLYSEATSLAEYSKGHSAEDLPSGFLDALIETDETSSYVQGIETRHVFNVDRRVGALLCYTAEIELNDDGIIVKPIVVETSI